MTHERTPNAEAAGGPEHDDSLPPAALIPGDLTAAESDLPRWEDWPDMAAPEPWDGPQWSGPTRNEV